MKRAIIVALMASVLLTGCSKSHSLEFKETKLTANKQINTCSLIDKIDGIDIDDTAILEDGKLTTSNAVVECSSIDTSILGMQEITYTIDERKITLQVEIVDDEAPSFTMDDEYIIKKGEDFYYEVDLDDNYDDKSDLIFKIEGEYDVDSVGEYELEAVAIDTAGNENRHDFTLKVVEDKRGDQSNETSYIQTDTDLISGDSHIYKGDGYQIITNGDADVTISDDDGSISIFID